MGVFLKIAVCDDIAQIVKIVEEQIIRIAVKNGFEVNLSLFQSGLELLGEEKVFDLCILDVDMPDINGFDVAEKIKQKNHTEVVFLTSHQEWIQQSFRYRPFAYLYKPVNLSDLEEVLLRFIYESKKSETNKFLAKTSDGEIPISFSEVIYLEVFGNETKVHTNKGSYVVKKSIKKWLAELKNRQEFFQCHQSYVVNFEYITHIAQQTLSLNDEIELPISYRRRKQVRTAFQNYLIQRP